MARRNFQSVLEAILKDDTRYQMGAYVFVRMALDFSVKKMAEKKALPLGAKHVSTAELLEGIKLFALETFGPMAAVLFEEWGVKTCEDFGNIVFNMIKVGELSKSENDKIEDFQNGYDFHTTFVKSFEA